MMNIKRPDLSAIDPRIRRYIEMLERELQQLKHPQFSTSKEPPVAPEVQTAPSEPPTTINMITLTCAGIGKRTPRHLYQRQRRGGMGVFDIVTKDDDPPKVITLADEKDHLLVITSKARAFRLPVSDLLKSQVHERGRPVLTKFTLDDDERLTVVLPVQASGYLALVSRSGMVRTLRHHVFGPYMKPGTAVYNYQKFGPLAAAAWTEGDGDLFIATRQGRAIRFREKLVPPQGCLGIRVSADDFVVSITPVYEDSQVFLLSTDGKGTLRRMQGFMPNKKPGAGGKIALATRRLVCGINADQAVDVFIISRLSKLIRFAASEIPPKDGVVQGVNCISLRADDAIWACISRGSRV